MAFREPEPEIYLSLVALVCAVLAGAGSWQVALMLATCAVAHLMYCKLAFDRSLSKDTPPDGR